MTRRGYNKTKKKRRKGKNFGQKKYENFQKFKCRKDKLRFIFIIS